MISISHIFNLSRVILIYFKNKFNGHYSSSITEKNYQSLDILNKIYDLFQYYGAENIFGCNYDLGFEIDE